MFSEKENGTQEFGKLVTTGNFLSQCTRYKSSTASPVLP